MELPKILQVNPSPLDWKVWQDHLHNLPDKKIMLFNGLEMASGWGSTMLTTVQNEQVPT